MKKQIGIILILLASFSPGWGQTTLSSGDLAFVGINSDGDQDQFAFVLLEGVTSGTTINFTDCGWNHSTGFNTTDVESHIAWSTSNSIAAGTIVVVTTYNGNSIPTASTGTITGDKMLISIAGDQVFAYQGSKTAPVFIAGISFNQNSFIQPGSDFDGASTSNSTTALPEGLTMELNAVHVYTNTTFAEQDNSRYAGTLTAGTKLALMKELNKRVNWELNDLTAFTLSPFPKTFTVTASSLVISPITTTIVQSGGNSNVTVTSNTIWNASSNMTWLTLSASSGMENGSVTLTATANSEGSSRSATVTFSASGVASKTITITQNGSTTTDLNQLTAESLVISPSIVTDGFFVSAGEKQSQLIILDLSGRIVASQQITGKAFINTSSFTSGIYIARLNGLNARFIKK